MESPASALGVDLVRLICSRFPCRVRRLAMSAACTLWRTALLEYAPIVPPLPSPPLLLVPRGAPPAVACLLCGGDRHHVDLPEDALSARYFGSWEGGWVFVALLRTKGHTLLNLRLGQRIRLPDSMRGVVSGSRALPVVIQAMTLSSAPIPQQSVAAALVVVDRSPLSFHWELMFWRLGRQQGRFSAGLPCGLSRFEDLIHYHGDFHFLTVDERIVVVRPQLQYEDGPLLAPMERRSFVQMPKYPYEQAVMARYLVESRGALLMVTRFGRGRPCLTTGFRVFQMQALQDPNSMDVRYTWLELPILDGRMLFLSRGCSRSYEMSDFPGSQEGIYFKSDVQFWGRTRWDGLAPSQREMMMGDCGLWSGRLPGSVVRCFSLPRQLYGFMDYSPPVWLLTEPEVADF